MVLETFHLRYLLYQMIVMMKTTTKKMMMSANIAVAKIFLEVATRLRCLKCYNSHTRQVLKMKRNCCYLAREQVLLHV